MKKNAMLKIAAILMVAVLLTTCAISSTFAKYTTGDESSDSARVAKFGVEVTTDISTLFATDYKDSPVVASADPVVTVTDDNTTVRASQDAVAPGTKNLLSVASKITGSPEVDVKIVYTATLTLTGWTLSDATTKYCPVIFTVGNATYGIAGMKDSNGQAPTNEVTDLAALKTAVEGAIAAYSSVEVQANTDLTTIGAAGSSTLAIGWEWAFDKNDDEKDTDLGDLAADGTPSEIELEITAVVDQLD